MSTELWPTNVQTLQDRGIKFAHRPAARDIVTSCPECGSRLIVDQDLPFFMCLSRGHCRIGEMTFTQVMAKLR